MEELPPPNPYPSALCTDAAAGPNLAATAEPVCRASLMCHQQISKSECSPPLAAAVTVVVCTSPIPSHPSPALLEATLDSFESCTGDLHHCRTIVVCDGCTIDEANPHPKWGRVSRAQRDDYDTFKATLRRKVETSRFEVMELATHHGFARAVLAVVQDTVQTELCLVVQHDWLFVQPGFDVLGAAEAMLKNPELLPYVGAMSLSTVDCAQRAKRRYDVDIEPATLTFGSLRFLPLVMLQDKPFLAQKQWLCELCLATPVGKFPEDTVGQRQLEHVRANGLQTRETEKLYRTYVLDQSAPVTYHLSGRKVRADSNGVIGNGGASTIDVAMQTLTRDDRVSGGGFVRGAVFGHAAVPGLVSAREARNDNVDCDTPDRNHGRSTELGSTSKRFKGRCFICGHKGHSKAYCPSLDVPETC